MKNKGFTLAEILGVIIILGIISLIAIPIINKVMNNSKEKSYSQQVSFILEAARNWSTDNVYKLSDINGGEYRLTTDELETSGFLSSSNVINPRDDSSMTGCVIITYVSANDNYKYSYNSDCRATNDDCFTFDVINHTITDYDTLCSNNVIVPSTIDDIVVQIIGESAFYNKGLTSISFPESVSSLELACLYSNNLTEITIEGTDVNINNNILSPIDDYFSETYATNGSGTYIGTQTGTWVKE